LSRETNDFTPQAGSTHRAGEPTLEHSSSTPQNEPPSVQGYVGAVEAATEVATKIAAPVTRQETKVEDERALAAEAKHRETVEIKRDDAQSSGKPGSRRSVLIYAIAIFALGFIVVAIWFALSKSGPETANNNSTPLNANQTQQANKNAPALPAPGATASPALNNNSQQDSPRDARTELKTSLGDWVAATNSRDLNKQMAFYAPTLSVFYLKRNATQASVRAEKSRLQSQTDSIDVRVGEPEIQLDSNGQAATMRFHKSWSFSGANRETGEVVQELRWRKTGAGWKIVSERDVEVIRLTR
jgi:ketosteroid isomerase-like protein